MIRVLGICGSLRQGSYNRKLLRLAMNAAAASGATAEELDLRTLELPLYDGDIESGGFPPPAGTLKAAVERADLLLIASPEYNYSVTGALKNAVDWASRGERNSWGGKAAAIFGASTGAYGSVRGQSQLRSILTAVNVIVIPQPQVLVTEAAEAFREDGSLKDTRKASLLEKLVERALETARRLK